MILKHINTSNVASSGIIKQAELKCSPQGQFIAVFELENSLGESTIWYSSFDQLILDSDADGVSDYEDMCPGTPTGANVDAVGCDNPDVDGDGILNINDQCPDTPEGDVVNAYGCSIDLDGDGVHNDIDQCPDTPEGDIVDEHGCTTTDLDEDGVLNENDQCPGTPEGDVVDANGCSILQNCPCEGPRAGGLYKNKRAYLKCIKKQAKQYVKDSLLTKRDRKALLKEYKIAPCVPTAE